MRARVSTTLALFFLFAGCTKVPPPPLRIGTCIRIGCEPFFLARDLGYFKDALRLVEYTSSSDILRAIRNDAIGVGPPTHTCHGNGACEVTYAINLAGASLSNDSFLDFVRGHS